MADTNIEKDNTFISFEELLKEFVLYARFLLSLSERNRDPKVVTMYRHIHTKELVVVLSHGKKKVTVHENQLSSYRPAVPVKKAEKIRKRQEDMKNAHIKRIELWEALKEKVEACPGWAMTKTFKGCTKCKGDMVKVFNKDKKRIFWKCLNPECGCDERVQ